jgi:hypothetical protein
MMHPNRIPLGEFTAASREMDRRYNASKAKRDRGFMTAVAAPSILAALLAYVWLSQMVVPAIERVNAEYQEQGE